MLASIPIAYLLFILASLSQGLQNAIPESTHSVKAALQSGELISDSISPLEIRTLSDWKLDRLIIVSDIDGSLHGIDRKTGAFIWTLPVGESLVNISGNSANEDNNANILWFVEPFEDGSLFYFSPGFGLNKLPTSIKNLVMESPFSLNGDDKIYTGTRKTSLYTIDKTSGEVTKMFGSRSLADSCPTSNQYSNMKDEFGDTSNHLMLGKTTYELSIHSKIDSSLVWNVTYSHWGPNNIDNDLMLQNQKSADHLYFTPFHDKSLLALSHNSGAPAWISRLPSMAVNVFDIFIHRKKGNSVAIPHPATEFNELQHIADGPDRSKFDLCFLNKTTQSSQWYAMSYANFPTLIKSAPTSPYQMALQQHEKGFLDQSVIDQMRNLEVCGSDAEFLLSGIHKYGSLSSANLYQPGAKFEDEPIGDHGSYDLVKPAPWVLKGRKAANLMDGILFPSPEENTRKDLSIVDSSKGVERRRNLDKEALPVAYYTRSNPLDSIPIEKVSMLRRIFEDLVVMFTLIGFLMAFVKIAQKFKYLSPEHVRFNNSTDSPKASPIVKADASNPVTQPVVEKFSTETVLSSQLRLPESSQTQKEKAKILSDMETPTFSDLKAPSSVDIADESSDPAPNTDEAADRDPSSVSKKKRKRGSRGGKRGGKSKKTNLSDDEGSVMPIPSDDAGGAITVDEEMGLSSDENTVSTLSLVKTFAKPDNQLKKLQIDNNLIISNKILGYGSHGTVVYEGTFENRPVAVKRMLFDFYDIANHEVRLLQESDDHPNVIRYFCSQSNLKEKFLYIALELCVCSLEDSVEKSKFSTQKPMLDALSRNDLLHQLASGLNYLHSLKIVHRDLKPQNILLGEVSKKKKYSENQKTRLLISDFGLCKKLDADQSSFGATTHTAASGTSGWRAPELLRPDSFSEPLQSSTISQNRSHQKSASIGMEKRLTKAIDIFSLGCVFFYILTDGCHPFGDRYLREANIIKGSSDLSILISCCPGDYVEATHLISSMIDGDPKLRPDTDAILKHPFFWNIGKKLEFLLKVSDRFEIERRDPPSKLLLTLEKISSKVHQGDWLAKFDADFTDNLGKYRKYHTEKVMDLLRALRNKYHHYNDMPPELQSQMSPLPSGFYKYFNDKFPHLLMEIYAVVQVQLRKEHIFHDFF